MWFKNMQILQFQEPCKWQPDQLNEALSQKSFQPCGDFTASTMGWIAPLEEEGLLVHTIGDFMMFCLKIEEKIVPGSVVKELLEEKLEALSKIDGRRPSGKAREALKDEVFNSLLPRALAKSSKVHAYIDVRDGYLVMDVASRNKAEVFFTFLHNTVGSFPVAIPDTISPDGAMTTWLRNVQLPENFEFADACVLIDPNDKGVVRCKGQDITSENIHSFLAEGCRVTQMAMTWKEQVYFTLKNDLGVAGIRFLDVVKEQLGEINTESKAAEFDADFVIMTQTLRELIQNLMAILAEDGPGVEKEPQESESYVDVLEAESDALEDETEAEAQARDQAVTIETTRVDELAEVA